MRDLTLSTIICRCPGGKTLENLENLEPWVRLAKEQGSEMVCFPELNLTGYTTREPVLQLAVPLDQGLVSRLQDLALFHGVVILAGLAEKAGNDLIHASHVIVGPEGLSGVYRKLHVAPPEQGLFSPGDTVPVFELSGVRFGIQLCYDAHYPELSTRMALSGAEVILIPHASPRGTPKEKLMSWMRHLPARAYDNSVYVVAWNQTGENGMGLTFPGLALALGPSGKVIKQVLSREETLMTLTLSGNELDRVRENRMHFFLPGRRPDLFP